MTSSLESGPGSKRSSRKRAQQNKTPYHGVRKRTWGRYVSEIRLPGKKARVWLGSFSSPEKAARAYDSAAFFLKGQAAVLNFPDRVGLLPRPESSSTKDIQVAAAKAAVAYEIGESVGEQDVGYNDGGLESGSGGESESSVWWGLDELDLGQVSFGAVKAGPFLSPLRFDRVGSQELVYSSLMDEEEEFLLFPTCF